MNRAALPISLGGRRYLIDVAATGWRPLPSVREQIDQGAEPGEQSLGNQGLWHRSQSDWVLGAGQKLFDEPEESTRLRFNTSKGVDVWDRRALSLLKATDQRMASSATVLSLTQAGDYLYVVDDTVLRYLSTGPDQTPGTWGVHTAVSDPITAAAATDTTLYFASGATVYQTVLGSGIHSVFGSANRSDDLLMVANGRLIGADSVTGILRELDSAGVATTVWDPPFGGRWQAGTGAPNGMYVALNGSVRTDLYLITVIDATGQLAAPFYVGSLPEGERCWAMSFYGGVVVLGTSRGIRVAQISGSGSLLIGPLIEIGVVKALEPQGEFIWFAWSNYDGTSTGLGRLGLGRFTATLVPAYASDLMAAAQGEVLSIATYEGRRFFAVAGQGIYRELASTYVTSGNVRSGIITWGTPEPKALVRLDVRHAKLAAGEEVVGKVIDDEAVTHTVLRSSERDATAHGELIEEVNTDGTEVEIELIGPGATTPTLHRWTLRGVPTPFRADEILLAVDLHATVEHNGAEVTQDPFEEWLYLKQLERQHNVVELVVGKHKTRVYVEAVGVEGRGGLRDFTPDGRFVEGTWLVRLLTVDDHHAV